MAGRPTRRTPERAEVILRAIRTGMSMRAAAGLADMDRQTVWTWEKADPTFRDALARAHAEAEARFSAVVADDAFGRPAQHDDMGRIIRAELKANPQTAMWWLDRRRSEDYARHVQVDVMGLARRIAEDTGMDPAEVLAEAEAIVRGR